MNLFFLHLPPKSRRYEPDDHAMVIVYKPPVNTAEGCEFLDDPLRMHEQPLVFNEESVSAGYYEQLL